MADDDFHYPGIQPDGASAGHPFKARFVLQDWLEVQHPRDDPAGVVFVLQLAVLYLPFLQRIFYTQPLSSRDLAVSLVFSSLVFWAIELEKWLARRKEK
jgi:hypothetical protein